jgi:hypothetical protein
VEFFEAPKRPPSPPLRRHARPDWFGPPENIAPGVLPLELVLANTGDVAVYLDVVLGYPTGFLLTLEVRARQDSDEDLDPIGWEWRMSERRVRKGQASGEIPRELLRFGIQLADGGKVTNIGAPHAFYDDEKEQSPSAAGPRLTNHGGGGGGGSWHEQYWLSPLPPPGDLVFVCEWPQQRIPLTKATIDAHTILEAAGRARELWPIPDLPEPSDDGPRL